MLDVVSCYRRGGHDVCCFCRNVFFFLFLLWIQSVTDQPLDDAIELVFFLLVSGEWVISSWRFVQWIWSEVLDLMEAVLYTHIRASPTPLFFGSQALNQSQFKLTHPLLQSTEPPTKKSCFWQVSYCLSRTNERQRRGTLNTSGTCDPFVS